MPKMSKVEHTVNMEAIPLDVVPEDAPETYKMGTVIDQQNMYRVGKTQELRRNFRLISIVGFTAVLMCTWEAIMLYALKDRLSSTVVELQLIVNTEPRAIFYPMAVWLG